MNRRFHVLLLLLSIASAAPLAVAQPLPVEVSNANPGCIELLKNGDLAAWWFSTGQWLMAGDVALDLANDRKLAWKDGTANLVNGPAGRTDNFLPAMNSATSRLTSSSSSPNAPTPVSI